MIQINFIIFLQYIDTTRRIFDQNKQISQIRLIMPEHYDFVVVGAGTMGRSTALYLSLQYPHAKCALLQQYSLNHEHGSSHATTRIIRTAYSHPFYRDLSLLALQKYWKDMETLFDTSLIINHQYLKYVHIDKIYEEHLEVAKSSKNIKLLSSQQVKTKFLFGPKITVDSKNVFLEEDAGIIMAEKYMNCMIEYLKAAKNIDIFEHCEVISINNNAQKVDLEIKQDGKEKRMISGSKVALTCGRWMNRLVPSLSELLKPVRQLVTYWEMVNPENYLPASSPSWSQKRPDCALYCLPDIDGAGLKYALHMNYDPQLQKMQEKDYILHQLKKLIQNMETHYPNKFLKLKKVQNCYYTYTKSQDFLIDWTDHHENVLIISACSGHGFKFSPVIGQIAADLLHKDSSFEIFMRNRYLMRMEYHAGMNLQ